MLSYDMFRSRLARSRLWAAQPVFESSCLNMSSRPWGFEFLRACISLMERREAASRIFILADSLAADSDTADMQTIASILQVQEAIPPE